MIDFHSHVIHDIDDGSHSVEESITMMKMSYSQGSIPWYSHLTSDWENIRSIRFSESGESV